MRRRWRILALACASGVAATPAHAHTGLEMLGGFWSGVVHFLLGFERPALVMAVAIWAGTQARRADAALVGAVALGAFAAALVLDTGGAHEHSDPTLTAVVLALVGAASVSGLRLGERATLVVAVCGGALAGSIGAAGDTLSERALGASGISLAAAATASYTLVALAFVAPWSTARAGLRFCVGAGAIATAVCALGHADVCAPR